MFSGNLGGFLIVLLGENREKLFSGKTGRIFKAVFGEYMVKINVYFRGKWDFLQDVLGENRTNL